MLKGIVAPPLSLAISSATFHSSTLLNTYIYHTFFNYNPDIGANMARRFIAYFVINYSIPVYTYS
jgi:hypothetical protein